MSSERLTEMLQLLDMPMESLESSSPEWTGKSYGMLNVQARLRLAFGRDYGITLHSSPGVGTRVTIVHPLMRELPAVVLPQPSQKITRSDSKRSEQGRG